MRDELKKRLKKTSIIKIWGMSIDEDVLTIEEIEELENETEEENAKR